jgi:hypothetical protein
MPKTFDSDFYVVCATVIPVLFLAVAVQGNAYKTLLDTALKVRATNADDSWRRKWTAIIRARTLQRIGYAIWCAGALGEFLALLVLYQGHEQPETRITVFFCTVLLVFAAAMGPLNAYNEIRKQLNSWQESEFELQQSNNVTQDTPAAINSGLGWPEGNGQPHGDRQD